MSYFTFMACGREMPTGLFGHEPKAVYDSYLEYKNSPDYVPPPSWFTAEIERRDPGYERKQEKVQGKIAVYATHKDHELLSVHPFTVRIDRHSVPDPDNPGKYIAEECNRTSAEVLMRHFTLPFLYDIEGSIEKYLSMYLRPGERAEVYTCWAGEEALPREKEDATVDLEEFVRGTVDLSWLNKADGNQFTVYLAPREPVQYDIKPIEWVRYAMAFTLKQ
jgi:hypothetical protein